MMTVVVNELKSDTMASLTRSILPMSVKTAKIIDSSQVDVFKLKENDTPHSQSSSSCSSIEDGHISSENEDSTIVVIGAVPDDSRQYCLKMSILSMAALFLLTVLIWLCRDYLKHLLLWMEHINLWVAAIIFALLFTLVSFPMFWGYFLLNVAAGYLYGFCLGLLLVFTCASIGIMIAHSITKHFLSDYVMAKLIAHDGLRAIMRVVESPRGFKVVALARLTPIPFGLQNGLFAIAKIGYLRYILSTMVGLLPTQVLNTYVGTTLRSMEEVLTDSSNSLTAYAAFIIQLFLTVILTVYVVRRAKQELNRVMEDENSEPKSPTSSPVGDGRYSPSLCDNNNKKSDPFCHRRNPSNQSYVLLTNEELPFSSSPAMSTTNQPIVDTQIR